VLRKLGASHQPTTEGLLTSRRLGSRRLSRLTRWKAATLRERRSRRSSGKCATGTEFSTTQAEERPSRASVQDAGGRVRSRFTGLGSPWWDPLCAGSVLGLTLAKVLGRRVERTPVRRKSIGWSGPKSSATSYGASRPPQRHAPRRAAESTAARAAWTLCASSRPTCSAIPVRRPIVKERQRSAARVSRRLAEGVWSSPAEAASSGPRRRSHASVATEEVERQSERGTARRAGPCVGV